MIIHAAPRCYATAPPLGTQFAIGEKCRPMLDSRARQSGKLRLGLRTISRTQATAEHARKWRQLGRGPPVKGMNLMPAASSLTRDD